MWNWPQSYVATVPGMEMGLPMNSPFDFIFTLWAGIPWPHRRRQRPKHKWGKRERERERAEDERQSADVGTEKPRQNNR